MTDASPSAPTMARETTARRRGRALARGGLVLAVLLAAAALHPEERETAAAREQARLCERKDLEEGARACRAALALGIGPDRRGPVRELLAQHLVDLERWDELAELLRENVQLAPQSAAAWQRLGLVLLYALDLPAEATSALEEADKLAPADASVKVALGLALLASGRLPEAVSALEEALRLDSEALAGRPAARASLEAARRGERWP